MVHRRAGGEVQLGRPGRGNWIQGPVSRGDNTHGGGGEQRR